MDGFTGSEGVIVLAATNRPDVLDAALLRPGRFDRRVYVNPPDAAGREAILRVHTRNVPLAPDVDLRAIASSTPGMVGADLRNLVNEAALTAARRNHEQVELADFTDALERIILGAERQIVISQDERERTAYHESGHALLGMLRPGADPVRKVSIVPRGRALGVTFQSPDADRYGYDVAYLRGRIVGALGGRAAEQVVYGDFTTGAESDLEQVTRIARMMVGRWGMSEKVGMVSVLPGPQDEPLLFPGQGPGGPSEETRQLIDSEVRRIVEECYAEAIATLTEHRDQLESLTRRLLDARRRSTRPTPTPRRACPAPGRRTPCPPSRSPRRRGTAPGATARRAARRPRTRGPAPRRGGSRRSASPGRRSARCRPRSPGASRPTSSASPSTAAGATVAAASASAHDRRSCVQARFIVASIDSDGAEPGLKSVASTTRAPASASARAGGIGRSRYSAQSGRQTAATPDDASSRTPSGPVCSRWSTDAAPSSAASGIAPHSENWSPWMRSARPSAFAAARYGRHSSAENAPRSRKQSAAVASGAQAGRISSIARRTNASADAASGGSACSARQVPVTRTPAARPAAWAARSIAASCAASRP